MRTNLTSKQLNISELILKALPSGGAFLRYKGRKMVGLNIFPTYPLKGIWRVRISNCEEDANDWTLELAGNVSLKRG